MTKFNDQSEGKSTGWNRFLVAPTTVTRHENKSERQISTKKQS